MVEVLEGEKTLNRARIIESMSVYERAFLVVEAVELPQPGVRQGRILLERFSPHLKIAEESPSQGFWPKKPRADKK